MAGETFLPYLLVFPEEISIWMGNKDCPPPFGWVLTNPLRTWIKQKGRGRVNLNLAWAGISIFSNSWILALLVLRPPDCDGDLYHWSLNSQVFGFNGDLHHQFSWFSGLWTPTELHWLPWCSPSCQWQVVGLLCLRFQMSNYNKSTLILFLCRTFINTLFISDEGNWDLMSVGAMNFQSHCHTSWRVMLYFSTQKNIKGYFFGNKFY